MNVQKTKRLFAKLDEEVKEFPWMSLSLISEVAVRALVTRMWWSAANAEVFQQMAAECDLIADAIGRSWQRVMAYNCMYDLSRSDALGCTVGSVGPYWLRVLDWGIPEGIGKFTVKTTLRANDGSKLTSVGFHGFTGVVTAFNSQCALSMNRSPAPGVDYSGVPACYYTRLFAQKFAARMNSGEGLRKAVKQILAEFEEENMHPMTSCLLFIRNHTHHSTLELVLGHEPVLLVKSVSRPLALSNHLNSRELLQFNPEERWEEDGDIWVNDTYERQQEMLSLLRKLPPRLSLKRVLSRIRDPILNDLTAYCCLMDFSNSNNLITTE